MVEFETASKRDVEEAVQEINAEDTTYLNLTIASGLNRVKKFARKAIEVTFFVMERFSNAYLLSGCRELRGSGRGNSR